MRRPMYKIFINDVGRLRSGWRLLLFVFAFVAASFFITIALRAVYALVVGTVPRIPHTDFVFDIIYRVGLLAAALGTGYFCARLLEGLPWRSLGLTLHTGWLRDLIIGSVVGFVSLAIAVGIARVAGGVSFSVNNAGTASIGKAILGSAILLFGAALAEEAMFRGYPLQTLTRAKLA